MHADADAIEYKERVVLPGDDVTAWISFAAAPLRLGQGLFVDGDRVRASRAGILSHLEPSRFFVASSVSRYTAAVGDAVVGIVRARGAEAYSVHVRGSAPATLPLLAFDGASRRNKPSLAPGACVFARVVAASRHVNPELACTAPPGAPKKDWASGESLYGELVGGRCVAVPSALARRLLDPTCALLSVLGRALTFQLAVGLNGLVWVCGAGDGETAAVVGAIESAAQLDEAQCAELGEEIIREYARKIAEAKAAAMAASDD
jgi:exosome complex component RRP40